MGKETKAAAKAEKETHFYVKFRVKYIQPVQDRLGLAFYESVVTDLDIPLRKLTTRELKFLKENIAENWLLDQHEEIVVLVKVRASTPMGHWEAFIDWLHNRIDYGD